MADPQVVDGQLVTSDQITCSFTSYKDHEVYGTQAYDSELNTSRTVTNSSLILTRLYDSIYSTNSRFLKKCIPFSTLDPPIPGCTSVTISSPSSGEQNPVIGVKEYFEVQLAEAVSSWIGVRYEVGMKSERRYCLPPIL